MNTKDILASVLKYTEFYTLKELDNRAHELAKRYGFEIKEVGRSELNHPLYLIKAGSGKKSAFIWGFPHPNEPVGSLTIDSLLTYFGENPQVLADSKYTWYCMFTADPDGTKLNEGWFKQPSSLTAYFHHFYRPNAPRMIDWTFPITKEDYVWNTPCPETKILMKIIDTINPDIMYPLHNAGFSGAYFFFSKDLGNNFHKRIHALSHECGMPLHLGEPEEPFMQEMTQAIYREITFTEYYNFIKKGGGKPKDFNHGDNSAGYLLRKNPSAFVLTTEVSYFIDDAISDTSPSPVSRRDIYKEMFASTKALAALLRPIVADILQKLPPNSHWYDLMKGHHLRMSTSNDAFQKNIETDPAYDRTATNAEAFSGVIAREFYRKGLGCCQILRATKEAKATQYYNQLEAMIKQAEKAITEQTNYRAVPIKNLVKLQLGVLAESINALSQ